MMKSRYSRILGRLCVRYKVFVGVLIVLMVVLIVLLVFDSAPAVAAALFYISLSCLLLYAALLFLFLAYKPPRRFQCVVDGLLLSFFIVFELFSVVYLRLPRTLLQDSLDDYLPDLSDVV